MQYIGKRQRKRERSESGLGELGCKLEPVGPKLPGPMTATVKHPQTEIDHCLAERHREGFKQKP